MQLPHQIPVDAAGLSPKRVHVGSAPTVLFEPGPSAELVLIVNRGTLTAYVGESDVLDASNGTPLPPLGSLALTTSVRRYAIAPGVGGTDVYVLPAGVSYTPAPSEIAAQIALNQLTIAGAATARTPAAGTPTFAQRNASASSAATATLGGGGSTTLIAAPGAAAALELHGGSLNGTATNSGGITVTGNIRLDRSDGGGTVAQVLLSIPAGASVPFNQAIDLQGATLPTNVGLLLVSNITGAAAANLAYSVVT